MLEKSFNEDVHVAYNNYNHSYFYNNEKLDNATTFIGKFYKKFDNENISAASAKAWGVEQQEVKDLWKSNGELAGGFGTAVHKVIEHYFKYRQLGEAIQKKKALESNYAFPKHPILLKILKGFIEVYKTEGTVTPEALVTFVKDKYCGRSDNILVLDQEKKICRVQDWKVNINSEEEDKNLKPLPPFDTLPANKLTKYQIQLSFYANLLQKTGWTVLGLDTYVLEDGWKHYSLEVLKII